MDMMRLIENGDGESQAQSETASESDAPISPVVNSPSTMGVMLDMRPHLEARRRHEERRFCALALMLVAAFLVGFFIATMPTEA